jgi:hypothetical protein
MIRWIVLVATHAVLLLCPFTYGAEVKVEGTLKALDANARTLTVEKKVARGTKELTLQVTEEAGDLASLKVGEPVSFSYDSTLEVVTKIITPGKESAWLFYDLVCKGVTPEKQLQRISDDEVRCRSFAEAGTEGPYLLVTSKEYEAFLFHCEFYYETETLEGNPFVGIASPAPPEKGTTFKERFPQGIEVKLWHRGFGSLLLPSERFEAEMVYGQARQGKVVPVLKQQVPIRNGWSTLEIEAKKDKTILVRGNGVLLNAVAKAENTKGHIVIFPPACELRIRNVTVEVDGEKERIPITDITSVPCR